MGKNEVKSILSIDYTEILNRTISILDNARINAARQVNTSAIMAYYEVGEILHEKKLESKHGSGVVLRLSDDLRNRYPDMGLSPRQLWNMKKFYERFYGSDLKLLQSVAVLPWSHVLQFLSKDLDDNAIMYYAQETIAKGWNRDLLRNAIKMEMHKNNVPTPIDNNFPKKSSCRASGIC